MCVFWREGEMEKSIQEHMLPQSSSITLTYCVEEEDGNYTERPQVLGSGGVCLCMEKKRVF